MGSTNGPGRDHIITEKNKPPLQEYQVVQLRQAASSAAKRHPLHLKPAYLLVVDHERSQELLSPAQ